jgi:multisubunit Na+/H+ antiporter MnhG subunit
MKSETLLAIVQVIRTLLLIFAAIGTIFSIIGFLRMFQKWNKPGILSVISFTRGWFKYSGLKARIFYALSDGIIVVLTPIFYYIKAYGAVEELVVRGYLFYLDKAMLAKTAFWVVAEVIRLLSSVHISANLCRKNNQGKAWIASWILLPKLSKIV